MKERIRHIVDRTLTSHKGGEEFFDELDRLLMTELGVDLFAEMVSAIPKHQGIILTGKFGKAISAAIDSGKIENRAYFLFDGGIRKTGIVTPIKKSGPVLTSYVMLDDTIYSGTTFLTIKRWVERTTIIKVEGCFVAYDGWPESRAWVKSKFRFYDEIKIEEVCE